VGRPPAGSRILVFSRTTGYRHASIPDGIKAIRLIGAQVGLAVEETEDPAIFTDQQLSRFAAVVFLSTTGDILDSAQQASFERFIRAGGGFAGVHSATDTEYEWSWYGSLVGAYFKSHPVIQPATLHVTDPTHGSTRCIPAVWARIDEWYDFQAAPGNVTTLLTIDESSYQGATFGSPHPMAWFHHFDGGRAWYTELGHTSESYTEAVFVTHLAGGIIWAATR
jgi:type 1 glutamine amidotransferase